MDLGGKIGGMILRQELLVATLARDNMGQLLFFCL